MDAAVVVVAVEVVSAVVTEVVVVAAGVVSAVGTGADVVVVEVDSVTEEEVVVVAEVSDAICGFAIGSKRWSACVG